MGVKIYIVYAIGSGSELKAHCETRRPNEHYICLINDRFRTIAQSNTHFPSVVVVVTTGTLSINGAHFTEWPPR